ncbi:MAG TPA: NBR1-Ig-like domain-containing protein [Anaerolineales bacterium]|nr:NBR1-Ig-like domain-containing protein [Anaerolineales bacterium]
MKKVTKVAPSFRVLAVAVAGAVLFLAACAPGMTEQQVKDLVQQSVAETVQAQNGMATSVALTVEAMAPAATSTPLPTLAPASLPTLTPVVPTVTPFTMSSGGGGGGGSGAKVQAYACSFTEVKPRYNTFKPGDYIDFVWIITNTGSKQWPSALDLDYVNGTHISPYLGEELPQLKPGERVTITFEGNAPTEPGFYHMNFKVQGGLCFPFTDIEVIKPPGQG